MLPPFRNGISFIVAVVTLL